MRKFVLLLFPILLFTLQTQAQKRDKTLTIQVSASTGESLSGQEVNLTQTDYSLSYGTLTLDDEGQTTVKVYTGNHSLNIRRAGYQPFETTFVVNSDTTVKVSLTEETTTPYALTPVVSHDAQTGKNNITLTWNREKPVFFDDFDSYEPFAIQFGDWTGIDRDGLSAAQLVGSYPNRGVFQYAQIINPMTVEPAWWYDYPVLRPYSGLQYVGFTRTETGEANDDWLISPVITPGTDNVLQFYAKAADKYDEKFQVLVSTKTDNPTVDDFTLISEGNYETVDYRWWQLRSYSLAAYAGTPIRFAIRYVGNANNGGAFMLMVDNVYVGQQPIDSETAAMPLKRAERSPLNPNETFNVYIDGTLKDNTDQYTYTFTNLDNGTYRLGVQSVYKASQSEIVDTVVNVEGSYAAVTLNITTNNGLSVDGNSLTLTSKTLGTTYTATISEGKAFFASLPLDDYLVSLQVANYDAYEGELKVEGDMTSNITLTETLVAPYNLTADLSYTDETYNAQLQWNHNTSFNDSFETYDDFASGAFGDWRTYDLDGHVCYPISLNGTIITFPGASTTSAPAAVPPLVFNPKTTTPSMESDPAVIAPDGDKTVIFFSPQSYGANKWLVSPKLKIRQGDVVRFDAKAYTDAYGAEQMEIAVSTTGNDPQTNVFSTVSTIDNVSAGQWLQYETNLSAYAGKEVYIGLHYISFDCFFTQVDEFFVGDPEGKETVDVGAVQGYDVYLDDELVAHTEEPSYMFSNLSAGTHTAGVEAVYASGRSSRTTITLNTATGISTLDAHTAEAPVYNVMGQRVSASYKGIKVQQGRKRY